MFIIEVKKVRLLAFKLLIKSILKDKIDLNELKITHADCG